MAAGKMDPLVFNALKSLIKRKAFMKGLARGKKAFSMGSGYFALALPIQFIKIYRSNDGSIVQTLMSKSEALVRELQQMIENLSGDQLFDFIVEEVLKQLKEAAASPQNMGTVFVGVYAVSFLNKKMEKWLGEKSAADSLSKSEPNNVTSEMGLELLDVADVVRQYPEVMEYLKHADNDTFFEDLTKLEGGNAVSESNRVIS